MNEIIETRNELLQEMEIFFWFLERYFSPNGVIMRLRLTQEQFENVVIEMQAVIASLAAFRGKFDRIDALIKNAEEVLEILDDEKQRENNDWERVDDLEERYEELLEEIRVAIREGFQVMNMGIMTQENFRVYLGSLDEGRMEVRIRDIL